MKIPLEWLREFIDIKGKPEEIAERLTMVGTEVSAIEFHGKGIEGVVVGKVKSIEAHQKTPGLFVLQADLGTKMLQLVTNVATLKMGDKVPVAVSGAKLAKDVRVEVLEIHGIESFGMLCSAEHLGLVERASEVMILDKDSPIGADIKSVLGVKGTIFDLDVLPNRGDLLSIIGFAREASAVFGKPMKLSKSRVVEGRAGVKEKIQIEVKEPDLCPRYMARVIEGIKIGESPQFIKDRLISCALRPINNVVDITNYVLLEMGQPLHAFDLNHISGRKIVVRRARDKEEIVTLDGEKRKLEASMLVISDSVKVVAIAGIMGCSNSEVKEGTTSIVLESAYFSPVSINKTSRMLKVRTEAAVRFERGVDWDGVELALERAAYLMSKYAGGKVLRGVIDKKGKDKLPKVIPLRTDFVNKMLGTVLSQTEILSTLKSLGFKLAPGEKKKYSIGILRPTFRAGDIEREIDLVEEIARIIGYDKIKSDIPRVSYSPGSDDVRETDLEKIRQVLSGAGFYEAQTFSFINPKEISSLPLRSGDIRKEPITVTNPLSEETSALRTMLSPMLMEVIARNVSRQNKDLAVFEVGKVFLKHAPNPIEKHTLALAISGSMVEGSFNVSGPEGNNFYALKGAVETLLESLGITKYSFLPAAHDLLKAGRSARIVTQGKEIGSIGEADDKVLMTYDVSVSVCLAEIDLEELFSLISYDRRVKPIGRYPKVTRDIAMFVPEAVSHSAIEAVINEVGSPTVEMVRLFDRYKGKQVPEGFVSLAYTVDYRDLNKTLTDAEVNIKHDAILEALTNRLKVSIRKE